jgi:hypothetical protein
MNNIEFGTLTNDELESLIVAAGHERERRKERSRQDLWNKVVKAIKDYQGQFGTIEVVDYDETSVCIDSSMDFSTPGEINPTY